MADKREAGCRSVEKRCLGGGCGAGIANAVNLKRKMTKVLSANVTTDYADFDRFHRKELIGVLPTFQVNNSIPPISSKSVQSVESVESVVPIFPSTVKAPMLMLVSDYLAVVPASPRSRSNNGGCE